MMRRVVIVSDRDAWASAALDAVVAARGAPERLPWAGAWTRSLERPVAAIAADVVEPAEKLPLFRSWADRGRQPLTIVSLGTAIGTAKLAWELDRLGYDPPLYHWKGHEAWEELQATLELVLDRRLWLVPEFVRATECVDPPVVRAITAAVRFQPGLRTVGRWLEVSELENYTQLYDLLVGRGLPRPKRMLSWIRLAWGVAYAREIPRGRSRREVASQLRYSSADYLGRWCRRLTGAPFQRLADGGFREVMRRFRASQLKESKE